MKCVYHATVQSHSENGEKIEENATVLNLSASGVYLMLTYLIQNGQTLSVKIAVPTGSLEWGSSKLTTAGEVVRTEMLTDEVLGVGIAFHHYRFI
jgi:hypothetical protein